MAKKKTTKLPKEFKKYFWEYDFEDIISHPFKTYILARIMHFGDLKALKWLLNKVPKKRIIHVINNSRELDLKTRNYWKLIYGQ